ncbi:DMT family transporter [Pseudomonas sp. OIL-1]|uniref:DMT family transporter n=1 Tax=Pseudomonas sp. OIL-1 TaxID=2706126 RepID=UPI0013A77A57|nr:DMT family transporter [Pseudomonas sp. OIL-1]QIB51327.1 DMT family transporter [Pseudomonas sp. OIL-1]
MNNTLQPAQQYQWRLGYLLLGVTAIGWGVNFPVLKLGLENSPPLLFTCMRMMLGTLTMFAIAMALGVLKRPARADWPVLFSVGILQNMAFISLVTLGLEFMPAGRAAILAYTTPIWVVPAAALFLGERFTLARMTGVLLGLGGLITVFDPLSLDWDEPGILIGGGLILLATLTWTAGLIHVRKHRWHGDVLALIPWQLLVSVVALVPIALVFEDVGTIKWESAFVYQLFFSGTIASGICVAAQVAAIRSLPAVSMSVSSAAIPAVGLVSSAWFLGEQPSQTDLAGFLLIATGILLVGLADRRQALRSRKKAKPPRNVVQVERTKTDQLPRI